MSDWANIQAHMRSTYKLDSDEAEAMSMVWSYDDGRSQRIVIRRFDFGERIMAELKSPFARLEKVDPLEMLRENGRLPLGAVALSGDIVLLVHNVDLARVDLAEFDSLLSSVAGLADKLETKYAREDAF